MTIEHDTQQYEGTTFQVAMADLKQLSRQLRHKDGQKRRKAMRELFLHPTQEALSIFVEHVGNNDEWVIKKSLDGIRNLSHLLTDTLFENLMQHKSVEIRRVCSYQTKEAMKISQGVLSKYVVDNDVVVAKNIARAMASQHQTLSLHIPIFEIHHDVLRLLLRHPNVDSNVIELLQNSKEDIHQILLTEYKIRHHQKVPWSNIVQDVNLHGLSIKKLDYINQQHQDQLVPCIEMFGKEYQSIILDYLKNHIYSTDHALVHALLKGGYEEMILRWLHGIGKDGDELRWLLLRSEQISTIQKSRCLERLIGRCNDDDVVNFANTFIEEVDDVLLVEATQGILKASNELH